MARRRYLLGKIGRGNDHLGRADVVVGYEHHLDQPAHGGIVVDHLGHVVDQLDDELCQPVARRRLAGEDAHPRHPVLLGMGAHRVVERDRLDDVEELALVFVDALDLDVEERVRVHAHAHPFTDEPRQVHLVGALDRGEALLESGVVGVRVEVGELVDVVEETRADGFRG